MGEISTIYAQIFCLATLNRKKKYYSTIFVSPKNLVQKQCQEMPGKKCLTLQNEAKLCK